MPRKVRIIPRLDIKGQHLIKGINLEGLRKVGDPLVFAQKYYQDGADELLFMDAVASLYGKNNLFDTIKRATQNIFIPITLGGGIRNAGDVETALLAGAEKVAINTAAIKNPDLINQLATRFGSQCIVISIEAKKIKNNLWECFIENGREHTYKDPIEWSKEAESRGAGEILLTSVDHEGMKNGYDITLTQEISEYRIIPVIASGGMGTNDHLLSLIKNTEVTGASMAHILHWAENNIQNIKKELASNKIKVRNC